VSKSNDDDICMRLLTSFKFRSHAQLMRAFFRPNESTEPAGPEPDRVEDLEEDTMSSVAATSCDLDESNANSGGRGSIDI